MFGVGKKIKDCMYKYLLEWIGFNADESQDYHDSKTKPSIISLNLHFADGEPEKSLPLQYLIPLLHQVQSASCSNCKLCNTVSFTLYCRVWRSDLLTLLDAVTTWTYI